MSRIPTAGLTRAACVSFDFSRHPSRFRCRCLPVNHASFFPFLVSFIFETAISLAVSQSKSTTVERCLFSLREREREIPSNKKQDSLLSELEKIFTVSHLLSLFPLLLLLLCSRRETGFPVASPSRRKAAVCPYPFSSPRLRPTFDFRSFSRRAAFKGIE